MADWSNVGKTKYGPGSRLTRGGETRFYIPNYNWLRQDTGGKWVSPEGFKKWWADNKPGQEPPDMTRQGVPAGQTPREPLVKGKPAEPLKPSEPAGETPEQKRARERAEIAKRHAQMRADLERDFPGDKPRPAADQSAIEKRHAELRKSDEDARIRRRYFYDKPEDSPKPVVPKPAAAQPEPEPKPAVTQTSSGSESFPLKRERTAAEISGLEKWASIYGRGKRKELKQFTPSQERLFKDLKMEAYDVVLDYLLSEGHADTVDEAHYVMMQLDSEYIQSIVEDSAPIPNIPTPTPTEKPKDKKKPPADTKIPDGSGYGPEEGGVFDREVRVPPNSYGDLRFPPNQRFNRGLGGPPPNTNTRPNTDPTTNTKPKPRKPLISLYPGQKGDGLMGPYIQFGNTRLGIPNISPFRPDK